MVFERFTQTGARCMDAITPILAQPIGAPEERWQHGQVMVRAGSHYPAAVSRGVSLLVAAASIGPAECYAAERFFTDYVHGVLGARDPERQTSGAAGDAHDGALSRTRAIGTHRTVAEIIGAGMTARLVAFLVDEMSFKDMAAKFMPNSEAHGRRLISAQMVTLLMVLAGLYAWIDRARPVTTCKKKILDAGPRI